MFRALAMEGFRRRKVTPKYCMIEFDISVATLRHSYKEMSALKQNVYNEIFAFLK
jgi:hypothetical protein